MSALAGTPTARKSLSRTPSMSGPSIASCFGATVPVSPRRIGGHGLLAGQAFGNYKQLNGYGTDEEEDEDEGAYTYTPRAQAECVKVSHRRQWSFSYFAGRQRPMREKGNRRDVHYASEGEGKYCRERTASMKLGSHCSMREKPRMSFCSSNGAWAQQEELYESEQGCDDQYSRERSGGSKLGKLWRRSEKARKGESYAVIKPRREEHDPAAEDQRMDQEGGARERKAGMAQMNMQVGRKQGSMREKEGTRRETLCRRVREACMQVMESVRSSSPHVSELFVGNQLLMQVTSSSSSSSSSSMNARRGRNVAPSMGFLAMADATSSSS